MPSKSKKALLVCGGYIPSQMLYLIPIVSGYCKKKKISTILFNDSIPSSVKKNKLVLKELDKFNVVFLDDIFSVNKVNSLEKFYLIFKSLFLSIILSRESLLNNYSWSFNQLMHSIWDLSMLNSKKEDLSPSFLSKLKASHKVNRDMYILGKALQDYKIDTTFIGHTVYQDRGKLITLREKSDKIFAYANFCFYRLPKTYDTAWNMPENKIFEKILINVKNNQANKYWKNRIRGLGEYEDSVVASKIKTKTNRSSYPKNVILLHIFKDSPFNLIDPNRIFSDYVDWIIETLKIVSKSKERWAIRFHPNAKRWGENQREILNKIFEVVSNKAINNLFIDDQCLSNNKLFLNVKKVVTFSGTPHLEAACFGIKPIVIRSVAMSKYKSRLVFKVKSKKEYHNLLLVDSSSTKFKLSNNDKLLARKLLFIQEKIIPFKSTVAGSSLYRSDSSSIIEKEFRSVQKELKKNKEFLSKLGRVLGSGISHSVNKPYLHLINKQRIR